MIILTATTPYDPAWDEVTMPSNIGGDSRRTICLYKTVAGTCDGVYSVWARKGTNPWVRLGAAITVAASVQGHSIVNMESINSFDKIYVSAAAGANADRWFLTSGGNMGYE